VINAQNTGRSVRIFTARSLNGAPLNKIYLTHGQITAGGEVKFEMDSGPDYKWATGSDARPPPLSRN